SLVRLPSSGFVLFFNLVAVAKRLDLGRGLDSAVGHDPLQNVNALLKLLYLAAEPRILRVIGWRIAPHLPHRARRNAHLVANDAQHEHQDDDGQDELIRIHSTAPQLGLRYIVASGADSMAG